MRRLKKMFLKSKNTGLILIDQGLVSGTNFIVGVLLTRFLGLEDYGQFVLLWMAIVFSLSITQALITKPLQSMAPKMEAKESKAYLATLHSIQLLMSLLGCLLCIIICTILSQFNLFLELDFVTIISLSIGVGLVLAYDYYRKCFFLDGNYFLPLVTDGILAFMQLGGIVVLHQTGSLTISSFLILIAITYSIVCGIGYFNNVKPNFENEAMTSVLEKHFDFSKWLLGTVGAQWFCGNFFIICAGGIIGTAAVGAVRIAQNVIGLTHIIFLAMENIVPINAAKAFKKGGRKNLYHFLKNISVRIGWAVMGILILISIFSPNILNLLYGSEYIGYSYILIGFCIIYLLVYIGYPLRFALRTLEMTKPIFIAYIIGATFSILSASTIVSHWGIYGVLVGLFTTQLITQSVYIYSLWKTKKYYENHSLNTR